MRLISILTIFSILLTSTPYAFAQNGGVDTSKLEDALNQATDDVANKVSNNEIIDDQDIAKAKNTIDQAGEKAEKIIDRNGGNMQKIKTAFKKISDKVVAFAKTLAEKIKQIVEKLTRILR